MAVYKVPQDVEADDKLIGPFTFKQFVFIIITVGLLYLTYVLWRASPALIIITLPGILFFGVLGFWPRRDQPVEVYLMAVARFYLKPRKRLWNQEGMVEHVHINVPKNVVHHYTDGLSRNEVQSRLKNLADNLDSRGWTSRNVTVQAVTSSLAANQDQYNTDRLVMPQVFTPTQAAPVDIHDSDDIMDVDNNPVAQNFDQLAAASTATARQQAIDTMEGAHNTDVNYKAYPEMHQRVLSPEDGHYESDSQQADQPADNVPPPQPPTADETKTQQPPADKPTTEDKPDTSTMTETPSAAILELSRNSDLNIETLARQAEQSLHDDETIELH